MAKAKDAAMHFCENSSLVGAARMAKANTIFLRMCWILFTISMVTMLTYSVATTVQEYLQYSKSIHSMIHQDDNTAFPAITICNHLPFSSKAPAMWNRAKNRILSPADFSNQLRRMALASLSKKNLTGDDAFYAYMLHRKDTLSTYYQNLTFEESLAIGQQVDDMFAMCMVKYSSGKKEISSDMRSCFEGGVITLSHPEYFNCFYVRGIEPKQISWIRIIINLKKGLPFTSPVLAETLTENVYEQSTGLRVIVHEADIHPNLLKDGVNVQPGSKLEIAYHTNLIEKKKTPLDDCVHTKKLKRLQDLNVTFMYDGNTCSGTMLNEYIIKKCKCMLAKFPRPIKPSKAVPYCAQISSNGLPELIRRYICIAKSDMRKLLERYNKKCPQRCAYFEYPYRVSITQWQPTEWQNYWAREMLIKLFPLSQILPKEKTKENVAKSAKLKDNVLDYLKPERRKKVNITTGLLPTGKSDYVYITLQRITTDTNVYREKLMMPLTGMVSQIGGLCGIFLGLSTAFVMEIFECCCRCFSSERDADNTSGVGNWLKERSSRRKYNRRTTPEQCNLQAMPDMPVQPSAVSIENNDHQHYMTAIK